MVAKSVMARHGSRWARQKERRLLRSSLKITKTASAVSWHLISRTLETSRDFHDSGQNHPDPCSLSLTGNSYYHGMALTNAEFLKAHLRNAKIVRFNDGIHDLELQKPEDVAATCSGISQKKGVLKRRIPGSSDRSRIQRVLPNHLSKGGLSPLSSQNLIFLLPFSSRRAFTRVLLGPLVWACKKFFGSLPDPSLIRPFFPSRL